MNADHLWRFCSRATTPALVTQFIWMTFGYNDDRYTVLTAVSLVFCYGLLCAFAPKGFFLHKLLAGQSEPEEKKEVSDVAR